MGWRANGNAKQQAKYDAIIKRNSAAADRREAQQAQHRGMSGHPSNPDKRVSFADMSDRQLAAHGMVRTRGFFGGTTISRMETHQEKHMSRTEEIRIKKAERKEKIKQAAKAKAKKAAKNAIKGKGGKPKKPFFSW